MELANPLHDRTSLRKQRRMEEDKKRMAYRRAIEDYREQQALQAQFCDFPELLGQTAGDQRAVLDRRY